MKQTDKPTESIKICTGCGETKPLEAFSRGAANKGGYRSQCKACAVRRSKQWASRNRAKLAEQARHRRWRKHGTPKPKPDPNAASRICNKCQKDLPIEDFPLTYHKPNQRAAICKACKLDQTNRWREENKERCNAQARRRSKTDKAREQGRIRTARWRERRRARIELERMRLSNRKVE